MAFPRSDILRRMPAKTAVGLGLPVAGEPYASVRRLFSDLRAVLSGRFAVRTLPGYADWSGDRTVWREHLESCDLSVNRGAFALRSELGLDLPILYLPLGDMPRGGGALRAALPHMRAHDTIAFSSRADLGVFDALVSDCKARRALVPFGVDESRFAPAPAGERARLRARLGLPPDAIVFLYAGRVSSEKNVHSLLALFRTLLEDHPRLHLLIVGETADRRFDEFGTGPFDMTGVLIRALARHGHVADRVHLRPPLDPEDMPAVYNAADAFVNMTLHHDENFGYAQVEAMSCGLPVVGTDWGGLKDAIEEGRTGFKARTELTGWGVRVNLGQAHRRCEELIASSELRARLGAAGRETVLRRFTLARFGRDLRREIESCLERRGPAGRANRLSAFGRRFYRAMNGPVRFTPRRYGLYRGLIAPYCSDPAPGSPRRDGALFLGPVFLRLRGAKAVVEDPLWPAEHGTSRAEREILRLLLRRRDRRGIVFTPRAELRAEAAKSMGPAAFERGVARLIAKGLVQNDTGD